jgi:hypothetical protein
MHALGNEKVIDAMPRAQEAHLHERVGVMRDRGESLTCPVRNTSTSPASSFMWISIATSTARDTYLRHDRASSIARTFIERSINKVEAPCKRQRPAEKRCHEDRHEDPPRRCFAPPHVHSSIASSDTTVQIDRTTQLVAQLKCTRRVYQPVLVTHNVDRPDQTNYHRAGETWGREFLGRFVKSSF